MSDSIIKNFNAIIDDEKEPEVATTVEKSAFIVRGNGSLQTFKKSKPENLGTFEWYNINKLLCFRITSCTNSNNWDNINLVSSVEFPGELAETRCSSFGFYIDSQTTKPILFNCKIDKANLNTLILSSVNKEKLDSNAIQAVINRWFFLKLNSKGE